MHSLELPFPMAKAKAAKAAKVVAKEAGRAEGMEKVVRVARTVKAVVRSPHHLLRLKPEVQTQPQVDRHELRGWRE